MTRVRVGIVSFWHETNTYSPRPTSLGDFESFELCEGEAVLEKHRGSSSVVGGFVAGLASDEAVGIFAAGAWPGGSPDRHTTAALLDGLERALAAAPTVDGVLVNLHGAMVARDIPDMELAILSRIRRRFGAVPVAAVFDLHANISAEIVACCDAVVGYRTYPHEDMWDCGVDAAAFLQRALAGEKLVSIVGKLAVLTSPVGQGTNDHPMRGLLARAAERAMAAGVFRVSLFPGFPYSDVERAGFGVVVVANECGQDAARNVAATTLGDVSEHLSDFRCSAHDVESAVARALAMRARPVVLADLADNIGGGGPGDGTAILRQLVDQRVCGAVVLLVDALAVARAREAGVGAEIDVALGGRADSLHGKPVRLRARVVRLGDGRYRAAGSYMTGQEFSMGATAVLEASGVRVVTMERPTPPFHLEQLTANGIDPSAATIIALKGAVAWRAPYASVARGFLEVDTPGCCPADPYRLPRSSAPRAVDPWDATTTRARAGRASSGLR